MDDSEGFKTPVEEVTTNVVETERQLELEGEFEDVAEFLSSHDNTWVDRTCFLEMSKKSGFLRQNLLLVTILKRKQRIQRIKDIT